MAFSIKENDTRPNYVAQLKDNVGLPAEGPIDLTTAINVSFIMRTKGSSGSPKIKRNCTIVDAVNGIVSHAWIATDTNQVGSYDIEFEIVWNDGGIETVPNIGYLQVNVVDDLG